MSDIIKPRLSETVTTTPSPRNGAWSLDLCGTRESVCRLIDAAPDVPPAWKELLKSRVVATNEKFAFVDLDAHCSIATRGDVPYRENIHLTVDGTNHS